MKKANRYFISDVEIRRNGNDWIFYIDGHEFKKNQTNQTDEQMFMTARVSILNYRKIDITRYGLPVDHTESVRLWNEYRTKDDNGNILD